MTPVQGARTGYTSASGVIAALVTRTKDRFALRRDLRGLGEVRFPRNAAALLRLIRSAPVRLVIAEPRDPALQETAPVIRAIRAAYPSIPILVLCDLTADDIHLLVDLVRSGADDAIVRSVDRVGTAAARLLSRGVQKREFGTVLDEICDLASPEARSILDYAIEHPAAKRPVEQIASALGVNRRTLVNRLSAAGLPRPSVFVAWGRLLVAASLLENPVAPLREVARALGMQSSAGLHVLCRRHSRLSVRELRRSGSTAVLERIRRALQSARRPAAGGRGHGGERQQHAG